MPTGKKNEHIHKLKRHVYTTGSKIFFCTLPDCLFKIDTKLALGKRCICNRCGQEFNINEISIRQALPHCEACTKRKVTNAKASKGVRSNLAESSIESMRSKLPTSIAVADEDEDVL